MLLGGAERQQYPRVALDPLRDVEPSKIGEVDAGPSPVELPDAPAWTLEVGER